MIYNFREFSLLENNIMDKIQSVLTPDLLKGNCKNVNSDESPMAGHCYAATDAPYWMLGGKESGWIPHVLSHKNFPEGLREGGTHWFLKNTKGNILDPTKEQFEDLNIHTLWKRCAQRNDELSKRWE